MNALTIRPATADDAVALHRLAALDSAYPPTGDMLVAEMEGEIWAALDLDDGRAIADPFRPSGELVGLLRFRAARLGEAATLRRAPAWRRALLARAA
jgi:hypothetical protein